MSVDKQVQWVLLYIQRRSADIQKDNTIKDLENSSLEFMIVENFLTDLKQEFRNKNDNFVKVAELKKVYHK